MKKNKNWLKSDIVLIVLSAVGLVLSLFLTYNYYSGGNANFCLTGSGCEVVKDSRYSNIQGVPVALIGVIGYFGIILASVVSIAKKNRWNLLFLLSITGVSFSIYLTYIELYKIKAICSYCIVSFLTMLSIFVLVILKRKTMSPKFSFVNTIMLGLFVFAIVLFGSHSLYSSAVDKTLAKSNESQRALARHLGSINAIMYGSFKCPHCLSQKEMFGEAFKHIKYVECHKRGNNANPSLCFAKGIRRFPTWEINGRFIEGEMTFDQLSEISGFENKTENNHSK